MEIKIETQLSFELQEIYLENKEWQSDILFLVDEMRFFKQIFQKILESPAQEDNLEKVESIKIGLATLEQRREHLSSILNDRQIILESLLKEDSTTITIAFIEEDTKIINEIKALLAFDKIFKKRLFVLIEQLQSKDKVQKYPIL